MFYYFQSQDAVCLSDYCDIFRCDIVSGAMKPDFWDSALCIEDDMAGMVEMCDVSFSRRRTNIMITYVSKENNLGPDDKIRYIWGLKGPILMFQKKIILDQMIK